jgi:hypothetical protein
LDSVTISSFPVLLNWQFRVEWLIKPEQKNNTMERSKNLRQLLQECRNWKGEEIAALVILKEGHIAIRQPESRGLLQNVPR